MFRRFGIKIYREGITHSLGGKVAVPVSTHAVANYKISAILGDFIAVLLIISPSLTLKDERFC